MRFDNFIEVCREPSKRKAVGDIGPEDEGEPDQDHQSEKQSEPNEVQKAVAQSGAEIRMSQMLE